MQDIDIDGKYIFIATGLSLFCSLTGLKALNILLQPVYAVGIIYLMIKEGTLGDNKYGANPLDKS